jgi:hypothetical protein
MPQLYRSPLSAFVLLAATASAQSTLFHVDGVAAGGGFGYGVAGPGDMSGDGIPDWVVVAPYKDVGSLGGRTFAYSGSTGALLWSAGGLQGNYAVAAAGDVDHDGRADVVVGAMNSGAAVVYSGANGAVLRSVIGPQAYQFGLVVAGGADMNADGTADFVVGGPYWQGSATIYSGVDSSVIHTYFGPEFKGAFGSALAVGDLNGDGFPDLLVGMPYRHADVGAPHKPGRVLAYSGADNSLLFDRTHSTTIDYFGASVAILGDSDGDGVSEYVVGAPLDHDAGNQSGEVALFSGASGVELASHAGAHPFDRLGWTISRAGDIDADGYEDWIAGTNLLTPGPGSYASALSGRTGAHLFDLSGPSPQSATFGWSVSSVGDLDGDGLPEVAVGDMQMDAWTGSVWIESIYPHGVRPYGSGTSGCTGPQGLTSNASPQLGSSGFELRANHAPAGGLGLAYFSSVQDFAGSDPFGLGVLLHIGVLPPAATFTRALVADAHGLAVKGVPMPADPALSGISVYTQAFWLWPNASCPQLPSALSSSSGLTITFEP